MKRRTPRVAYLVSHPIQYQAPFLRRLAASGAVELKVFFLSDFSARDHVDRDFGARVEWDVPLLDGYESVALSSSSRLGFLRPLAWELPKLVAAGGFDALWVHGWAQLAHLRAIAAAARAGVPVFLRGESVPGERGFPRNALLRGVLRRASAFLAIGRRNRAFYEEHGVEPSRVFFVPYAVDNERFRRSAEEAAVRREELRAELGLEAGRPVLLYASKLIERKRPELLFDAYRSLSPDGRREPEPYLLYAGEGTLRGRLERRAAATGWSTVRFLGFRNQTELPALYDLCDAFVLPSVFETWGLVVNEAMNAARPIVASDGVGAVADLVRDGETGWTFPKDDAGALAERLRALLADPAAARAMGERARDVVGAYSFEAGQRGLLEALAAFGAGAWARQAA